MDVWLSLFVALTPNVTVFEDKTFKGVISV